MGPPVQAASGIGDTGCGRPAEFKRHALYRVGGLFDDDLADGRAASEGDLVDVGMLHQRSAAGFTEAGDDVDDAGRQAAIGKVFRKFEGRERSLFGRLENTGTARGQRRRSRACSTSA